MGFVRQAQVVDSDFWIAPPDMWSVWLALGNLSFAHLPEWLPQRDYWTWLPLALALLGVWQCRRQKATLWLLLVLWLLPPLIELLVSLRRPIFYDRTLIWTTLPYYVLVARGVILPTSVRWRSAWLVLTLLPLLALCTLGVRHYYTDFIKERWDEAARVVASAAQPDALVLFHASWAQLPFEYYYAAALEAGAPPLTQHGLPVDLFDAGMLEPPMTEDNVPRLLRLIEGRDHVWLVYSHWWYTDPAGIVPQVLGEDFEVAAQHEWPGIQVIHYQRRG